jgi:pentatricopeptide repeat protein
MDTRKAGYGPFRFASNSNVILATSIIEMFAKCGSFNIARKLFDKMPKRNIVNAYNQV